MEDQAEHSQNNVTCVPPEQQGIQPQVCVDGTTISYTHNSTYLLESCLIANSPSGNTWKVSLAKSEPAIASYVYWLAQHGVPTPRFYELQRWPWSTVPRNTPPQLGATAPTL